MTGAVQHKSQLQDNAGKLAVGRAGGQVKARLEARNVQKATFGTLGAGRGPAPSFTAMVFVNISMVKLCTKGPSLSGQVREGDVSLMVSGVGGRGRSPSIYKYIYNNNHHHHLYIYNTQYLIPRIRMRNVG